MEDAAPVPAPVPVPDVSEGPVADIEEGEKPYVIVSGKDWMGKTISTFVSTGVRPIQTVDLVAGDRFVPRERGIGSVYLLRAPFPFMLVFPAGGGLCGGYRQIEAKQMYGRDFRISFPTGLPVGAMKHRMIHTMRGVRRGEAVGEGETGEETEESKIEMTASMWEPEDYEAVDAEEFFHVCHDDNVLCFANGAMGHLYVK